MPHFIRRHFSFLGHVFNIRITSKAYNAAFRRLEAVSDAQETAEDSKEGWALVRELKAMSAGRFDPEVYFYECLLFPEE